MSYENGMTPADIGAIVGNNEGFGGGNGAYWLIILFLFAFCGWGNNGIGGGTQAGYTLASDFATIQRQLSDGFGGIDNALDRQNAGICDLGYTSLSLNNQTNMSMMQGFNALQAQLANCCCENKQAIAGVNYNMAMNTNALQTAIDRGFCQTNYNMQTATRDITDNANANTKAILDFLVQDKISTLQRENDELRLRASQYGQSAYLINTLRPTPIPAYPVPNPFEVTTATAPATA